ncbi:MAG: DNA polymerase I [Bacteroidales bacterium]|jgi:DNA polymerase-1
MTKKRLFLIDAMALIYRSYYALIKSPRVTSTGINTSATFGFTNFLLELIAKENPTHLAVCSDTIADTFRHEAYGDYKANREAMPEDIATNLPFIKELLEGFKIPLIYCDGYEADDIIGTIAKKAESDGYEVFMVTPDKDFCQLVTENIKVYKPSYGKNPFQILGEKEVCEKYGLKNTLQMIDYLGLTGDASDNIPGVKGIGPVSAKKLLSKYDSIDNIFKNIENIKNPSLKQKLIDGKEDAFFSKELVTIYTDVPCAFDIDSFIVEEISYDNVKDLFEKLDFRSITQRLVTEESLRQTPKSESKGKEPELNIGLFNNVSEKNSIKEGKEESSEMTNLFDTSFKTLDQVKHNYKNIVSEEDFDFLLKTLKDSDEFAFDLETTGLDPNNSEIVCITFSVKPFEAFFVMLDKEYNKAKETLSKFKDIFEDTSKLIIGQNIKFDLLVLKWYDINVKAKLFDTMIAHYLIDSESRHNLDILARQYLDYNPLSIENLIGKKGSTQSSMRDVEEDILIEYAAEDSDVTYRLYLILKEEIEKNNYTSLFENVEMPLVKVLASMEFEGVKIDTDVLNDYAKVLEEQIKTLEEDIYELAGGLFNINSPKQLGEILFEKLKISNKPKKTRTGQYSTAENELIKYEFAHPIISKILDYRSYSKLLSTYVEPLPQLINKKTGKIHTTYQQAVTATGRLSSTNPNLQNLPVRSANGKEIKKAFIASSDEYILVSADYSQIELRIAAHMSNDTKMINAFKEHKDIHTATAAEIFDKDPKDVTSNDRRMAKTVNFGILYGISAFGLSERLHISRKQSSMIIEQYFAKYSGLEKYFNDITSEAEKNGYVTTILGRRRYIKNINSKNNIIKNNAKRTAINAPIQGSSADLIKVAMVNIFKEFERLNLKSKMILQIHDELVFDTYKPELEKVKNIVETEMKNAIKFKVPIEVSIGASDNLLDA